MTAQTDNTQAMDAGFVTLSVFLRLHGVRAEPDRIRQGCGTATIGIAEMLRCVRDLGLKARASTTNWKRLSATPLPGIAALRAGGFLLLGKIVDDSALVVHPSASPRPELITRAEFESVWDGHIVLMDQPGSGSNFAYRFREIFAHLGAGLRGSALRVCDAMAACAWRGGVAYAIAGAAGIETEESDKSGLAALVMLLRCHGIGADAEQIRHRLGAARIGVTEMLRCAKDLGLKARAHKTSWARLARTPLPNCHSP